MTTNTNAALAEAERLLRRDAESLREGHTSHRDRDDWAGEDDAKAGYDEYIRAADALAALTTAAAVPPEGWVMVPVELAQRVQESLGEFLMDHGWSQRDMDTSDEFGAVLLAAAPKAEPVQAGEYPPMPQTAIDAMLDYIYEHGTSAEGVKERIESMLRAYVDADRAMRAQAAPQPAVQQGDELPREDFAWLVVQEACETEPADEDDPECIRILRRDLKSAVLSAFLRHDAAHPAAPVAQGDGAEPVAYLWQHSETGRTRVVMPDAVITADASWRVIGPLFLAARSQSKEGA